MKKLNPTYVLLTAMLVAIVTFGVLGLRKAETISGELAKIRAEQSKMTSSNRPPRPGGPVFQVEVVNTPTVECEISDTLQV